MARLVVGDGVLKASQPDGAAAAAVVRQAMTAAGFHSVTTGATTCLYLRAHRSKGMTVCALAGAPLTLGLSLLLLLGRRQERTDVTVEQGLHGVVVHVSGRVPVGLAAALAAPPALAPPTLAPPALAPPPLAPARAPSAPLPAPHQPPLSNTPSMPLLSTSPRAASSSPPLQRRDLSGAAARMVLDADWGDRIEVTSFLLLGRDPVSSDRDPSPVRLVTVTDATMSVSKTHLAVGVDGDGIWVCDRHSTNGSAVIEADGRRRPCLPGERVRVTPGSRVQVGNRSFHVAFLAGEATTPRGNSA